MTNPAYGYDADGNLLTGAGRTLAYTSFNMTASIALGSGSQNILYGPEHARFRRMATDGSSIFYFNEPISGATSE